MSVENTALAQLSYQGVEAILTVRHKYEAGR
jgi:hypothetical protein